MPTSIGEMLAERDFGPAPDKRPSLGEKLAERDFGPLGIDSGAGGDPSLGISGSAQGALAPPPTPGPGPRAGIGDLALDIPPIDWTRSLLKGAAGTVGRAGAGLQAISPVSMPAFGKVGEVVEKGAGAVEDLFTREVDQSPPFKSLFKGDPKPLFRAIFENAPTMAAAAGSTMAAGPAAGLGVMGLVEAGSTYQELEGLPEEARRAASAAVGVVNGLLEMVPFSKAVQKMVPGGVDGFKQVAKKAIVQAIAEGGTEAAQEYSNMVAKIAVDPEVKGFAEAGGWERIGSAAGLGAIMGGIFGGAAGGVKTDTPAPAPSPRQVEEIETGAEAVPGEPRAPSPTPFPEAAPPPTPEVGVEEAPEIVPEARQRVLEPRSPEAPTPPTPEGEIAPPRPEIRVPQREVGAVKVGPEKEPPLYRFQKPGLEERVQTARRGVGGPAEWVESVKSGVKTAFNAMSREYTEIPHGEIHAPFREAMRMVRVSNDVATDEVANDLHKVLDPLSPAEHDLFIKKRLMDDLRVIRDTYPEDTQLPFGLDRSDLDSEGQGVDDVVAASPAVKKAIEGDRQLWKRVRDEAADAFDLIGIDPSFLHRRGESYLHHQVMDYAQTFLRKGMGGRVKAPRGRKYQKQLKGSERDINLAYSQAQGMVLSQLRADTIMARQLLRIKGKYDVAEEVKQVALEQNRKQLAALWKKAGKQFSEEDLKLEGSKLGDALEAAGGKYRPWQAYVPEGYSLYQPADGRTMFSALSLHQAVANKVIQDGIAEVTGEDLVDIIGVGGPKKQWVLPEEIVSVLDQRSQKTQDGFVRALVGANEKVQRAWKKAALFFPRRYIKYATRNQISDWNVAFQGNPGAATRPSLIREAAGELIDYIHKGKTDSEEMKQWLYRGGLSSGLFHQEIGVSEAEKLKRLATGGQVEGALAAIAKAPLKIPQKYFYLVKRNQALFESLMRYAMFKDYFAQVRKGKGKPDNYGASIKEEIDALESDYDKAYWLSNELVGAYDMVSRFGQFLRSELAPFWSFQELNARTQWRLMRNALTSDRVAEKMVVKHLGRSALVKAPQLALSAGRFLALASAMEMLLASYNWLFWEDEERDLPESVRRTAHIILGRDKNGDVIYFNRLSRFQEFREWIGLAEVGDLARDYLDGRRSPVEIAKEMAKGVVDKSINTIGPLTLKGLFEMVAGLETFPQATRPRRIEDRWEHFFQMWGLEKEYDVLRGRPTRAGGKTPAQRFLKTLPEALIYKAEPGAASYYDTLTLKRQYMREIGKGGGMADLTPKTIALRRFKRALAYGQEDIAKKSLMEYALQGGTPNGLKASLRTMRPLYGLNEEEQESFKKWLRSEELLELEAAEKYYQSVFEKGVPLPPSELLAIFEKGYKERKAKGLPVGEEPEEGDVEDLGEGGGEGSPRPFQVKPAKRFRG